MALSAEEYNERRRRVRVQKKHPHACDCCGKEFPRSGKKQRFCSQICYRKAHYIYRLGWMKKQPKEYHKHKHFLDRCRRRGITPEEYKTLWDEQNGLCAICRKRPIRDIDHSHRTGKARGLLCGLCNRGLGQFLDEPDVLRAAADYLERTECE